MNNNGALAFDAVIVGAGLAGAAVAIELARAGWAVAVVEKQPYPRRKVCGACLAASNLPLLQALGVGPAFAALAGPELRAVTLLRGRDAATAPLPPAADEGQAWGRALGRDRLDSLLLEQARAAGATVFQPFAVQTIEGMPGAWRCTLRAHEAAAPRAHEGAAVLRAREDPVLRPPEAPTLLHLHAQLVIDAHGSWDALPLHRRQRHRVRRAGDLLAFKAQFTGSALAPGAISVLALPGAYGGMVVADGGTTTVACCIRRDRLRALRRAAPGVRAGDAVQAWLQRECAGVQQALQGARCSGAWLTTGPLHPGVHLQARDGIFRVGNAAGEAHPILGEGMSMALQSAALLASVLLAPQRRAGPGAAAVPGAAQQARLQSQYVAAWRRAFVPRLRLAALFSHVALRPALARLLMALAHAWPALLTQGARWGGKVRLAAPGAAFLHPPVLPTLEELK